MAIVDKKWSALAGALCRWRARTGSPRSVTSTPTSTRWRPSCSGPGSGRWPAGSRRSPKPATSPSTRSWTSRSSWSAPTTGVRAFHNACRHRGVRSSRAGDRAASGFICPFHGWCYGIDGENTCVSQPRTFSEHNLEPGDIDLVPVRCEVWGGCAWINLDDDAPPLRAVHRALRHHARRLEGGVLAGRVVVRLPPPGQLEAGRRGVRGAVPRARRPTPSCASPSRYPPATRGRSTPGVRRGANSSTCGR